MRRYGIIAASFGLLTPVFLLLFFLVDGARRVTLTVRKLERELLASGHAVCVLSTRSGDPANTHGIIAEHPNRRVVFLDNSTPIPFVHDPNNPELTYQMGFALSSNVVREIDAFEPTVVHLTVPDVTALHLIQYARQKELPVLGTYHSNIPEYMEHYPGVSWLKPILSRFFRHQYSFLLALYVPTPFIKRHLSLEYGIDRATALNVWGHGVDIRKFHPSNRSADFRACYGIDDDDTVVLLWVSRLVPEKRPDIFASVVRRLASLGLNFRALVVGAGPCERDILHLPNTTFCGWMNEDQLSVAYASSDVFLFPSSVETFGLVTLEAAASGLPVVVEDGCSGHLVRNGETGYACPEADVDAFFHATLELVTNHEKRRACAIASRKLSLSWENRAVVREMLNNYDVITEQFHTEFGGRYSNRDAEYRARPGSFIAGTYPRPLLLIVFEWLFLSLFFSMYHVTNIFQCVQQILLFVLPFRGGALGDSNDNAVSVSRDGEEEEDDDIGESNAIDTTNVESSDMLGDRPAFVELSEMESEYSMEYVADSLGRFRASMKHNDDAGSASGDSTVSNASSSPTASTYEETLTMSSTNSHAATELSETPPTIASSPPKKKRPSVARTLTHGLAKAFVRSVEIQCRMESNFRNACRSMVCVDDTLLLQGKTKRKNSGSDVGLRVDDDVAATGTRASVTTASVVTVAPHCPERSRVRRHLSSPVVGSSV